MLLAAFRDDGAVGIAFLVLSVILAA